MATKQKKKKAEKPKKKTGKEDPLGLPSMLAFDRKLEPSDALMHAGNWGDWGADDPSWRSIAIIPRQNRGTQSAYNTPKAKRSQPNPVKGDDANLPHDLDTLRVSFTLRMVGNLGLPFGCNDPKFESAIKKKVADFKAQGLKELSHRYAHNIACGRFLWRNRVCAEQLKIRTRINRSKKVISFDGHAYDLNNFESSRKDKNVKSLSAAILGGLNSQNDFAFIEVDGYVRLGRGQHVFPSQEMNIDDKKSGKVLFKLGEDGCAAMHSVKIGNAIRTIDDWYDEAQFPIAVEPFGSVTQCGQAFRKSPNDLYTLMLDWVQGKEIAEEGKLFVLANLIRGGVFSGKSE